MKNIKFIGLAIVVVVLGVGLYWWWENGKTYPKTDDAYLQANLLSITPQVSGQVAAVFARENAYVTEGDVLFALDPSSLQAALDIAQAQFDLATQNAGASGSNVAAAEAELAQATAALRAAQTDFDRTQRLFTLGDLAQSALDQATAARDQADAAVAAATAALNASREQLGASGTENAGVRAALGQLTLAQLNMEHATVTAPASGWMANHQPSAVSLRDSRIWPDAVQSKCG